MKNFHLPALVILAFLGRLWSSLRCTCRPPIWKIEGFVSEIAMHVYLTRQFFDGAHLFWSFEVDFVAFWNWHHAPKSELWIRKHTCLLNYSMYLESRRYWEESMEMIIDLENIDNCYCRAFRGWSFFFWRRKPVICRYHKLDKSRHEISSTRNWTDSHH